MCRARIRNKELKNMKKTRFNKNDKEEKNIC